MDKDFSELDLQLVMYDFNDTEEEREDNIVAGVAIRAEDAEAFAADVERLAVEKYGGATFAGLLDEDMNDDSMIAAQQRKDAERNEALLAEAERVLDEGLPEEAPKRRPMPSIKGKTLEQVKGEYEEATRRWEELQADPEGYGESELRERLLDYVDAGLCVDMAMRRTSTRWIRRRAPRCSSSSRRTRTSRRTIGSTCCSEASRRRRSDHSQCPPDSTRSQWPVASWWTVSWPTTTSRTSE